MKRDNIFVAIGVIAVLITGMIYLSDVKQSVKAEELYSNLANQTHIAISNNYIADDTLKVMYLGATRRVSDSDINRYKEISSCHGVLPEEKPPVMLERYQELYKQNTDLAGWISVGENIDYPIMKCADNENFYLHNDFNKQDSKYGALYLSQESEIGQKGINVIYGHSMKDGSMFGSLKKYLDADYLEANKVIQINSLYEEMQYEVVAVFKSQIYMSDDEVFKYYTYKGEISEEQFQEYIMGVSDIADYSNLDAVEYDDSLIELVTCNYHVENGRLVVLCKKI